MKRLTLLLALFGLLLFGALELSTVADVDPFNPELNLTDLFNQGGDADGDGDSDCDRDDVELPRVLAATRRFRWDRYIARISSRT